MISSRGQTTFDFAVGMSLFLTVVLFVFAFVPGMLSPFTGGTTEETAAVDRVADHLVRNALGHPTTPYVLDVECTNRFFETADPTTPDASCRYNADGGTSPSSVAEAVGMTDRGFVNVQIRGNFDGDSTDHVICWDESDGRLYENDPGDPPCNVGPDDDLFVGGSTPPDDTGATMTASRKVSLAGRSATLRVTMW